MNLKEYYAKSFWVSLALLVQQNLRDVGGMCVVAYN